MASTQLITSKMLSGKPWLLLSLLISAIALVFSSCDKKSDKAVYFVSPVEGGTVKAGSDIRIKTDAEPGDFDSVQYFVDSVLVGTRTDTASAVASTKGLRFGGRLITAKLFKDGNSLDVTTNIQLVPSIAPKQYSYEVVNVFPHDTSSYTQGLEFQDGVLYESDGLRGESSLRKVAVNTGKVLQKTDIDAQYFAEGISLVGDKIVMLTYQERLGFVYDKQTLTKVSEFPLSSGTGEGWGLAFDGTYLLMTDGSNSIYRLNKDTYQIVSSFEVFDNNGPVDNLNELEVIDGKIYANIYQTDKIIIINGETGGVEAEVNLEKLAPYPDRLETGYVLNGIAWDARARRLFVTGKKWNKLFEIRLK